MMALPVGMACRRPTWIAVLLIALACAACTPSTIKDSGAPAGESTVGKGAQALDDGVKSYEDGEYQTAAGQFQAALDRGLVVASDRARAHKYLAFITCVSGREKPCRDEFRKAFDADPGFDLGPAEAGHPIWGPVFRSVKSEVTAKPKPK
jgi:Tfp pilus assembly protein PilF